jgi:hypothetical protein
MIRIAKTLSFALLLFSFLSAKAQDPNFHIYLCFGQSNMEGQGTIEGQDRSVDSRFKILQSVACNGQPKNAWRIATPPLSRCNTNLGPADYFGRTMVANLPSNIQVGVVHVAVAGCKIELFDKNNYQNYINSLTSNEQWMKNIINEYGGNPYAHMVALAKLAQKDGVIKGILLHQGESNSGDSGWPNKVKGVYENLLNDLNLKAGDVPLLAGQVVDAGQGGQTAGHNSIINSLPNTIPTAHVISSSGCTAVSDKLHFTSAGYRLLGERYAQKMLTLITIDNDVPPTITTNLSNTTVVENQSLKLNISVSGANLNYKWYRNDQEIVGQTDKDLVIPGIDASYDGDKFSVVVSNSFGSVKSNEITLTVTDFDGVKFVKTTSSITIDGQVDDVWESANEYILTNKIGTIDNANDLSARVKVLYDDQQLYFLYIVTDNTKRASSNNFWENDGIEIYIDGNNEKASAYDANDFQFVVRYDGTSIQEGHDKPTTGIQAVATQNSTGYIVEVKIPWTTIGTTPSLGKLIGVDFHVNDSDAALRDGKITWFATEDESYNNPSIFGVGRLENTIITNIFPSFEGNNQTIFPNPFSEKLTIDIEGAFDVNAYDINGREILKSTYFNSCEIGSNWPTGIYQVKIISENKVQSMKVVKQ